MLFSPLIQNGLATLAAFVLALSWLNLMDRLANRGVLEQTLSRKLIHIGTGPLFILCWPLFSSSADARFWAAIVPLVITLKFVGIGLGWIDDAAAVKSMTRHNDSREILRGPLFYGIVFVVCTILFWRNSPIGMLALMIMCGGDGFADIVGRRFGTHKLPFNEDKSWAGSAAMLIGSFLFGWITLLVFNHLGYFAPAYSWIEITLSVALISIVATIVEALPFKDVDNLTLTVVAIVLGQLLLHPGHFYTFSLGFLSITLL